jgi:hypothetical protein
MALFDFNKFSRWFLQLVGLTIIADGMSKHAKNISLKHAMKLKHSSGALVVIEKRYWVNLKL